MPQVPYSPVPAVEPSAREIPGVGVATPGAAFGENIAAAVGGLGKGLEQSGSELFGRAYALKQLDNESEARDADAKYMIGAGQLHANYNALDGKARADAFPKYQADLEGLRKQIRGSLSNPMAARMYDASSLSTMGRSIFNGAGAAASGMKEYHLATLRGSMDIEQQSMEDDPTDLSDAKVNSIKAKATEFYTNKIGVSDPNDPAVVDGVNREVSKGISHRLTGIAKNDPWKAGELLAEYSKKHLINQDDYNTVNGLITVKSIGIGGTQIGMDTVNRHFDTKGNLDIPSSQLDTEIRDTVNAKFPENKTLAQQISAHAIQTAHQELTRRRYSDTQDDRQNVNVINTALAQGVNGLPFRTEQELLAAHPEVAKAVAALHNKGIEVGLPGRINQAWKNINQASSDERVKQINGMFSDPDQREAALSLDLGQEKLLSKNDVIRFQDKQAKLRQDVQGDPRVQHMVGLMSASMGQQMSDAGITKANMDVWNHFRGGVQSAIDTFVEDHKRRPTDQEFLKDIAPILLQTHGQGYGLFHWFGGPQVPLTEQNVPEDFATQQRSDAYDRQGAVPSDAEIYKAYVRSQFIKLYDKSKAKPK